MRVGVIMSSPPCIFRGLPICGGHDLPSIAHVASCR